MKNKLWIIILIMGISLTISIVYSIMELDNVKGIKITVDNNILDKYPNSKEPLPEILTKDIGINASFDSYNKKYIKRYRNNRV